MKWAAACILAVWVFGCSKALSEAEFPEPPWEWLVRFQIEEIPGKAALYYDIDGDGFPDLVTAHTIIDRVRTVKCKPPLKEDNSIVIGFDCRTTPKVYILERKIFAVRMVNEKWAVVIQKSGKEK